MKIVIYNDELHSEMQMYLALSNHYKVAVAADSDDLLKLMDQEPADFAFLEISKPDSSSTNLHNFELANKILKKHPKTKLVGICDRHNEALKVEAANYGISKLIKRPIKNRELLNMVEN